MTGSSKNTWTRWATSLCQKWKFIPPHTPMQVTQLVKNPPLPKNLLQSNEHNNTYLFNNQSISAEKEQQSYDTDSELSDDPENNHNI